MLRITVLILLLANGLYFAWSQSLLGGWGPTPVTEPQRQQQQVRPELLQLLPRSSPASSPAAVPGPAASAPLTDAGGLQTVSNTTLAGGRVECMVVGVFDEAQATALRQALGARLPPAAWGLEPVVTTPARWIVYMGRYPNAETVERKKAELRGLRVPFDTPSNPALVPGLALGRFDSEEAAAQELGNLAKRGVRTAHVAVERAEQRGLQVRLLAVDDGVRAQLEEVKLALAGKALKPCTV